MGEDFFKMSIRYRADFALAGCSDEAELLFTRGLAYCALNGTKGILPAAEIRGLLPKRAKEQVVTTELLEAGFWQRYHSGYIYRSWDKWQGTLNQVEQKRAYDAKRKRLARAAERAKAMGLPEVEQ